MFKSFKYARQSFLRMIRCFAIATIICTTIVIPSKNSAFAQTIVVVHVDGANGSATPPNNGDGWGSDAYKYLGDAIAFANLNATSNTNYHIWVAAGTYKPNEFASTPSNCTGTSHQRCYSFQMHTDVRWYGGFLGNEPQTLAGFNSRKPLENITILSGDIDGDDITDSDNSYHVVTANRADNTAIIDGFHIIRGYAADAPAPETGGSLSRPAVLRIVFAHVRHREQSFRPFQMRITNKDKVVGQRLGNLGQNSQSATKKSNSSTRHLDMIV